MADRKISDLTALTTPATGDLIPIVDISEAAAADKNKSITVGELLRGAPDGTAAAPGFSFESDDNTGIYRPGENLLAITTAGTERLRVDGGGRLLFGTTASRSVATVSSHIQVEGTAANDSALSLIRNSNTSGQPRLLFAKSRGTALGSNTVVQDDDFLGEITFVGADGTDLLSVGATIAARVDGTPGSDDMPTRLVFSTTADGSSSITERLRIGANGRVMVGDGDASEKLEVEGNLQLDASDATLKIKAGAVGTTGAVQFTFNTDSTVYGALDLDYDDRSSTGLRLFSGYPLTLQTGASTLPIIFDQNGETARFDDNNRFLIGTSSAKTIVGFAQKAQIEGTSSTTASLSITRNSNDVGGPSIVLSKSRSTSVGGHGQALTSDFLGQILFNGANGTDSNNYSVAIIAKPDATVTTSSAPGRLEFRTTASDELIPTERMRITSAGIVNIKTTNNNPPANNVTGSAFRENGTLNIAASAAAVIQAGRTDSDGELIAFYQAGTKEGTISVSGTTVSYNGAHLARWSQLPGGVERTEILRGSVLSNIDEMCEWVDAPKDAVLDDEGNEVVPATAGGPQVNEQLNRMQVSNVEGDRNVAGVFQAWDDDDDTYTNDFYCAMTGDFIIRIAQGVTVERGDLLMSAGDGTAKPQDDDIIRSKTIAKVTSTNVSCTYDDGSYCVPCVLMAC